MIESGTLYVEYNCNGSVETFNIGLEYLKTAANIAVFYTIVATGAEYLLVKDTNYTVDTVADTITTITGNITGLGSVSSPYASGVKLTIKLAAPYTQLTDIASNSNYPPETLESSYDKNCILTKQNKELLDRAIVLQESDVGTDMTLPPLLDLKNGVLGFDANGLPQAHPGAIPRMYDAGYTYLTNDIIQYDGLFYIALQSTTGNAPAVGAYWGLYNLQNINAWAGTTTYAVDAVVSYLGKMYISLQAANLNKNPITETSWWVVWQAASNVAITDSGGYYTATDVEAAFAELGGYVKSLNDIVLTNYKTTGVPAIAAGSKCTINGTVYTNPSEVAITGTTADSTWYDILLTPSGTSFTASFIARGTGAWSDSLQGLYSGTNRVVACAYRVGSTNWINKNILIVNNRTVKLKVEIGAWDIDALQTATVTHGLILSDIIDVSAWILNDVGTSKHNLEITEALGISSRGGIVLGSTLIVLTADTFYDSTDYDSTAINRGTLVITYEV